jgi:hypothetical protein
MGKFAAQSESNVDDARVCPTKCLISESTFWKLYGWFRFHPHQLSVGGDGSVSIATKLQAGQPGSRGHVSRGPEIILSSTTRRPALGTTKFSIR